MHTMDNLALQLGLHRSLAKFIASENRGSRPAVQSPRVQLEPVNPDNNYSLGFPESDASNL